MQVKFDIVKAAIESASRGLNNTQYRELLDMIEDEVAARQDALEPDDDDE